MEYYIYDKHLKEYRKKLSKLDEQKEQLKELIAKVSSGHILAPLCFRILLTAVSLNCIDRIQYKMAYKYENLESENSVGCQKKISWWYPSNWWRRNTHSYLLD